MSGNFIISEIPILGIKLKTGSLNCFYDLFCKIKFLPYLKSYLRLMRQQAIHSFFHQESFISSPPFGPCSVAIILFDLHRVPE